MAEQVLAARRLTKRYGGALALDSVSMSIEQGMIYGLVRAEEVVTGSFQGNDITNIQIEVEYGNGKRYGPYLCAGFREGVTWGGVVPTADGEKVTSYIILDGVKNVSTASFRSDSLVYHNGRAYTISEDVACYNKTTGTWLSLGAALAFSDHCTLYIDDNNIVRGIEVSQ